MSWARLQRDSITETRLSSGLATFTVSPVGVSLPVAWLIRKITTESLFWFAA
jgi:hypothetical protein